MGWRWETRTNSDGKQHRTKPPRQPSGAYAQNNKPDSWATLAEVQAATATMGFEGVGLQLQGLHGFAALDLDKVRNAETGEVLPWAAEVIAWGSYAEMTPSGAGFRVLGTVAADRLSRHNKFTHPLGGEVEFYISLQQGSGRYITVTGNRVEGAPDALTPIDDQVARLWADLRPKQEQKAKDFDLNTGGSDGLEGLPQWAQNYITHGGSGDRSANFQAVVNAMAVRMDFLTALRILEAYPQGPAGKYTGRLETELRRSWEKANASQGSHASGRNASGPTMARTETWGEPDPKYLRTVLPEPPALPLDGVFSPVWSHWIKSAADSKGAPRDYVVAALLSVTSSLIGNTRWAAPWSGWAEPPIIWAVAIGSPSAGKSPGLDAVLSPLRKVEKDARQAAKVEHDDWKGRAEVPSFSRACGRRRSRRLSPTATNRPPSLLKQILVRNPYCRAMQ